MTQLQSELIPILEKLTLCSLELSDIECIMTGQERRDLASCEKSLARVINTISLTFDIPDIGDPNELPINF